MTGHRVLRYEVPVDGQAHYFDLNGKIVHVSARREDVVEFWALDTLGPPLTREFVVVGTGHPYPGHWKHTGTALSPSGTLVWHLMEVPR